MLNFLFKLLVSVSVLMYNQMSITENGEVNRSAQILEYYSTVKNRLLMCVTRWMTVKICWPKDAKHKRVHSVIFCLYEILVSQMQISGCLGPGRRVCGYMGVIACKSDQKEHSGTGDVAQAVKHLLGKWKALSSNTERKEKKNHSQIQCVLS